MEIQIKLVSEETIKPSSPTPEHLRRYNFSFLDQITPDVYNPIVYFYSSANNAAAQISDHLKNSLSRVLTHYYPLAGRPNSDELFIDCNDGGVPFLTARVNCELSDVIETSFPSHLNKFLPFELDKLDEAPMGVQLNVFECGGIGVGVCISHKIGDALSFFSVVNGWAALSRGEVNELQPHLTSAKLFPARKTTSYDTRSSLYKNRVAKMYEIGASKIEAIRSKYAAAMENQRRPSRVEALSAFLYSRFIAAVKDFSCSKDNTDGNWASDNKYTVFQAVNIRSRLDPPLPEYAFGNYYRTSTAFLSGEIVNDAFCYGLVTQIREDISKINGEFLKKFQADDQVLEDIKENSARFVSGNLIPCAFTSLCRMPIYDADFGWGKPVWVGSPALLFRNLIVFSDKKDGDGIEVYIHLKEEHMAKLEADEEFLKYAKSSSHGRVKP